MVHWTNLIFGIICLILLYLTFSDHGSSSGGYGNISGLINVFFGLLLIIFIAIWGGIFWW